MCRRKDCLFVCRKDEWIQSRNGSHHRCPALWQQCRPWMEKAFYVKANKVMLCQNDSIIKGMAKASELDPTRRSM
eukprot:11408028-Prorocentrum_lima.AAC.1